MDVIILFEASETTPKISFNSSIRSFELEGYSLPNNPFGFYKDVIVKIVDHVNDQSINGFSINFKLKYFNTASTKSFHELIKKINEYCIQNNLTFNIIWELDSDEDDVKETVLIFQELFKNVPFTITEIN